MMRVPILALAVSAAIVNLTPGAPAGAGHVSAGSGPPPASTSPDSSLHGIVLDAETKEPVPGAHVFLDSVFLWISEEDGSFDFGAIDPGPHVLVVQHISYARRRVRFEWPARAVPIVIEIEPIQFTIEPIEIEEKRTIPSLPVSAVAFDREVTTLTPGTIASDPLRAVQSHPSAATAGIDFLSTMAIRGGNTEEHRVYFDDFPLRHYAHVGGFSSVIYDDMLESTVLVPGAAPLQYKGALSGIVMFNPQTPDTTLFSLRYDITSIAGGIMHDAGPSLKLQASAKSDFFNLPVYQQVGVSVRTFRDLLARAIVTPNSTWTLTPTLIMAKDSEEGTETSGVARNRKTDSVMGGIDISYHPSSWQVRLRPYYSYYKSSDELTRPGTEREHRLSEARLFAEVSRQSPSIGYAIMGEVGAIQHDGYGGRLSDVPFSGAAELRLMYRDAAAVIVGAGGSREEWTSTLEPEAYGSLRVGIGERLTLSGAYRRSHQTPFLFSERRYFASIPVDPGDLSQGYRAGEDVRAVRMDQTSVEARLDLPFKTSIEGNGFWRWYDNLATWDWTDFPTPRNVTRGGTGRGHGYEIMLARDDPDFLSFMVGASRARVWKTEGTLTQERIGDFDKPDAYQIGAGLRLSKSARLSARWTDVSGLPYTPYDHQSTPPPDEQVNSVRLERFQRLDIKFTYDFTDESLHITIFIDVVNFLNRLNVATTYALEISPGTFTTVNYGGTRFFPIGGLTVRW